MITVILNGRQDDCIDPCIETNFVLDWQSRWWLAKLLPSAKSVWFPPGDSPSLIYGLEEAGLERKVLRGKLLVAYSAGVSALTALSFNFDHMYPIGGLGIIQASSIVHYREDKHWWAKEYLTLLHPELPFLGIEDNKKYRLEVSDDGAILHAEVEELPPPPQYQLALAGQK